MQLLKLFLTVSVLFVTASSNLTAKEAKSSSVVGKWNATAKTDNGERELVWDIKHNGDKLVGVSLDGENERKFDKVSYKDKKLILEVDFERDGNKGIIRVEAETKKFGQLDGEWSIVDEDGKEYLSGDVSAWKEISFESEWEAVAELPDDQKLEAVLHLKGKNSKLKGVLETDSSETKMEKIDVDEQTITLNFKLDYDGDELDCEIEAKPTSDDRLVGKWKVIDDDGDEELSGEIVAERRRSNLAGKWKVFAVVPDSEDFNGMLTLEFEDGKYAGNLKPSGASAIKLKSAKAEGDEFVFTLPFKHDEYEGTLTVEAKLSDNVLEGEWSFVDEDGEELGSEDFRATRKK